MNAETTALVPDMVQLRLLLEEVCCDLCRFQHVHNDGVPAHAVGIDREGYLGVEDAFADIRVQVPGKPHYFIEVKFGYGDDVLVRHVARKYATTPGSEGASALVLVVDVKGRANWEKTRAQIEAALRPGLRLEVWDEERLFTHIEQCFGVKVGEFSAQHLMDARIAIDQAKGAYAFGDKGHEYEHNPLKAQLIWNFGFWRLRQLRDAGVEPHRIMPPGHYSNVVVLIADMCAFSSYMRDTSDPSIARDCLTAFYSRARYQIINSGGMMYQFVGDEVIGFYGLPEQSEDAASVAYDTARALMSIGKSVAQKWQRYLDRMQPSAGLHVGMAVGDLQIVSLRPFSRSHFGALGDCINLAARVMGQAKPDEVIVTNNVYNRLPESDREGFARAEPLALHNVGSIQAWKATPKWK